MVCNVIYIVLKISLALDYSEAEYTLALISAIYQTNTECLMGLLGLDAENVAFLFISHLNSHRLGIYLK